MGSDSSVEIKYTSDDRDHMKSLHNQQSEILKNQRALLRMGDAGGKSYRKVKSGADSALGSAVKFAGALTGVGSVVGGISIAARQLLVEFNRIKELQQSDADKQVDFENSLVKAVRNAGGFYGGQELKKLSLDLADETGASPKKVAEALSSAFSARGANNKEQAAEAVRATAAALKYAPDLSQEDTADLAGSGIDLSKRFGFTPEESLGYLKNVGSLARVVDPKVLSDQVAPAINNLADFGNSAQEAGSLVAAITQGSVDKNAARSGTAAIQLAAQLRERGIGDSTTEGIDILANDPKLRKKFLEGGSFNGKTFPGASFEKKQLIAIEQLLQPGSVTRTAFKEGIGQIGGKQEARAAYDTSIAENASVTLTSRFQRQSDAAAEASGIRDEVGGLAAVTRNALDKAFDEANFSDVRKKAALAEFEFRSSVGREDPLQVGESILEREQRKLLNPVEHDVEALSGLAGGPGVFDEGRKRAPTEAERQSANALRAQEIVFEKFIKEQERQPVPVNAPVEVPRQQPRPPHAPEPPAQSVDNKVLIAATQEQTGVMKDLLKEMVNIGKSQPQPQQPQVRPPERRPPWKPASSVLDRRN